MSQYSIISGFLFVSLFQFFFSVSTIFVMFRLEISFTSLSYCHTCTRIWPLQQYFDSHFFRYFIFSFISLGTPLSTCNVPQMYKCFFSISISLSSTVIVTVLVQVPSLLSSCALRISKTRFLMVVICQYTPQYYICSHFWTHKPSTF